MPRLPRVYVENALYYVTSKSGHDESLFADDTDYRHYVSLIDAYKRQYGFKLFSYVLMPTHLHLLIELRNDAPISNIMHDLNSLYTKNFNSKYNKKGHLFQERFKTLLAEKEPHLLPLTRYIHLHPKKNKVVDDPKDYTYSSHIQFLDPAKRGYPNMVEEIDEIFRILGGREKEYEEYVTKAIPEDISKFRKLIHRKRILGSKAFAERIEKTIGEAIEQQKKAQVPSRAPLYYIVLSGATVLILVLTVFYSYRSRHVLKSEYDKSVALYDSTLEMLKAEKDKAMQANKDIEQYLWKIDLAEKGLEELKQERMKLNGYAWRVDLNQTGGPQMIYAETDTLIFEDSKIVSADLSRKGFTASNYSKRVLKNENVVWETIQRNKNGERVNWRGEWDGSVMKGILRIRSADGVARDFSFASSGERMKR